MSPLFSTFTYFSIKFQIINPYQTSFYLFSLCFCFNSSGVFSFDSSTGRTEVTHSGSYGEVAALGAVRLSCTALGECFGIF